MTVARQTTISKPIGVFDSGFGGLSILRKIVKALPQYDYMYLGDTARAPYGNRAEADIYRFTEEAVDFLFRQGCELVVVACNTASSESLRKIQQEYLPKHYPNRRVLGVLIPAAEAAVAHSKNKRIGVVGTEKTVSSGAFVAEMLKIDPALKIFQLACPLLVPIVEFGEERTTAADFFVEKYLKPLNAKKIDTLILGCTHYEILLPQFQKFLIPTAGLITEASVVAVKLKDYLKRHPEIESRVSKHGKTRFYSTDLTERFQTLGSRFFGQRIQTEKAILG